MVPRCHSLIGVAIWHSGVPVLQECMRVEELKCNPFAARIVALFSEDGRGELSFQKFINLFSVFSPNASAETKTVWAFGLWDFDGAFGLAWNHHLDRDELESAIWRTYPQQQ